MYYNISKCIVIIVYNLIASKTYSKLSKCNKCCIRSQQFCMELDNRKFNRNSKNVATLFIIPDIHK